MAHSLLARIRHRFDTALARGTRALIRMAHSLRARIRYRFDTALARGSRALIRWLVVGTVLFVLVLSLFVWAAGVAPDRPGLGGILWMSFLRMLDGGTMAADQGNPIFLFSMLAVTLGGVLMVSTLIGLIAAVLMERIDLLRRGRSAVLEAGHTVILGWSDKVFAILRELVEANANQPDACVVILTRGDKVELEDRVRSEVRDTRTTRIVCRCGDPMNPVDLEMVGVRTARSVLVPGPDHENADADVIKVLLAIAKEIAGTEDRRHVTAEIRNPGNMDVARMISGDQVELVSVAHIIPRITAQTCREPGLSVVYTELLDFEGDEIYFAREPKLVGRTFLDGMLAYEDSTVIGILKSQGDVLLCPPMDYVIQAGDRVIAISADDDTVKLSGKTDLCIRDNAFHAAPIPSSQPERTLVLGWNWRAPFLLQELDRCLPAGSEMMVVTACEDVPKLLQTAPSGLVPANLRCRMGDPTDRHVLNSLHLETFNHVIVLSDLLCGDREAADARTLVTLLHLREISEERSHPFSIVSEMLTVRNRDLAEVARADDFIVSDRIVSLLLAQVSETKALNGVFSKLLQASGPSIRLKPVDAYLKIGEPVNFYTAVASCARQGEIALGYRIADDARDAEKSYGVRVNPDKSESITFRSHDRLVVLSSA